MIRSNAVRKSANGKLCSLNIADVCNYNPETTVLAHLRIPGVAGMSQKPSDLLAVYACSSCHDAIDGRSKLRISEVDKYYYFLRGLVRTLELQHAEGIIQIKGVR
jgi:hypothetical protein